MSPGSPADIADARRRAAQMGSHSKRPFVISFSEQTGSESRLALIHTLTLFQFTAKTATCIPVVPHSLRNGRLSHLLVVSVGTLLG